MEPEWEKKIAMKKSSVEIDENLIGIEDQTKLHEPKSKIEEENLLDLNENQSGFQSLMEYKEFLKNRVIEIQGPQLITQTVLKSYKLYKIKSRKKQLENYDTCVKRRFSDFEYLEKKLLEKYGGSIIPKLPEKNFWTNINMQGEQYIELRKRKLKKYLENLLTHPKIKGSEELKTFLFSDEIKFSEGKGEFFSNIKAEDKFKNIASSAFVLGKGLINKFIFSNEIPQNSVKISSPTIQDLKLLQYQNDIDALMKAISKLKHMVENTVTQMNSFNSIFSIKQSFDPHILLEEFQSLCEYIDSCNEALQRRSDVRLQMQVLSVEYEKLQKKMKSNPRSQELDIMRNKLNKTSQNCERWTCTLLQELENSVEMGKSMVSSFVTKYTKIKEQFYSSQK